MIKRLVPMILVVAAALAGGAEAQSGEWRLGGRALYVSAGATSGQVGDTGYNLKLSSGPGVEFDATFSFSERFAAEFSVGATALRLRAIAEECCSLDGGRVWFMPLTAMVQYHHPVYGEWDPYVGIGIGWWPAFYSISSDLRGQGLRSLEFDGDAGFAFQIGVNYQLDNRWYANLDLRSTQIELEARAKTETEDFPPVRLDISPFTIGLGFGYRF